MPNTNQNQYNFLGGDVDFFMKSSLKVYANLAGVQQFLGYTGNEKEFNPNMTYMDWYDNTGGVQTLTVMDLAKQDFIVGFSFMQSHDPNVLPLVMNMVKDDSDPNYTWAYQGSQPQPLKTAEYRFVGNSRAGYEMMLVIRKGVMMSKGATKFGASSAYAEVPCEVRALRDSTILDPQREMVYFRIQRKPQS
jgi:hypothetical protein